jgi:hypothetical protein
MNNRYKRSAHTYSPLLLPKAFLYRGWRTSSKWWGLWPNSDHPSLLILLYDSLQAHGITMVDINKLKGAGICTISVSQSFSSTFSFY